jgi:hypothetical protein
MFRALRAVGILGFCAIACAQNNLQPGALQDWRPMTADERIERYVRRTVGAESLLRGAAVSGIATLRDRPREWGQGAEGYTARLAHRQARLAVNQSVQLGLGFLLQDDPRYRPATGEGVRGKLKNAVVSTFTVRDRYGALMPAYSRFAGVAAGNVAASTWLPPSRNSWGDVATCTAAQLAGQVGWNVLREFTPALKRKFGK